MSRGMRARARERERRKKEKEREGEMGTSDRLERLLYQWVFMTISTMCRRWL